MKRKPSKKLTVPVIGLLLIFLISCSRSPKTVVIDNTKPRLDSSGQVVDAHDGCLQFFEGKFYLYGTAYGSNDGYSMANRYRVYSSPDLQHWKFVGNLLAQQWPGVYYRPYVVFNSRTKKYVLWYNWYETLWNGQTGVAISDTPTGPFTVKNSSVKLAKNSPGDGSLFVDDDGTGYYIYTAIDDNYTIRVERLTPDYLATTGETSMVLGGSSESPVLFKRENLYYILYGRRCAFCAQGSELVSFISFSPLGPFHWADVINIRDNDTNTFIIPGQQTWVANIPTDQGPQFVWMADLWQSAPDGIKGHDLQFWAPMDFNWRTKTIQIGNSNRWSMNLTL